MKSVVETLEPTKVKLLVEVSYDELKPAMDHAYQHIGEQIQVPGFRKGKVPPRIIDQRVGRGAVIEHAVNDGLGGFYSQAVDEAKIHPLARPEIEITSVPDGSDPEAGLAFTAEVEVRPEIELPELESLSVQVEAVEVTEDDVNERLDALRERFGTLVGVDRPAADGDFVVLDMKATVDDEEIDSVSGVSYRVGTGNMLEGLDEALEGLSAGETTTFEAPLAGGEKAGTPALVTVTAQSVKERELPEVDEEFVELASEFDTVEELREDLRTQVGQAKAANQALEAQNLLVEQLAAAADFPAPAGIIAAEIDRQLESEGRADDDEYRAEVTETVTQGISNQLLLDVLAETLEIQVSQNDLVQFMVRSAQQYGMDPNEFIKMADSSGQIPGMAGEVARGKALTTALRRITVTDSSGAVVDLTPFIGTDADDTETVESTEDADDPTALG